MAVLKVVGLTDNDLYGYHVKKDSKYQFLVIISNYCLVWVPLKRQNINLFVGI